jgi:1-deoxy-D-xylulose-5-phosphate reductoisomerase
MGINNSIDSSNFVNKVLEMIELSIIFNIDIEKIDFLLSKEAFIHSLIIYRSSAISVNAFKNDMLIPLLEPLEAINRIKFNSYKLKSIFRLNNFKLEKYNDKRFKIVKYIPFIKSFNQSGHVNFMLLNNIAQRLYINKNLNYNKIVSFIIDNVKKETNNKKFKSFDSILDYINSINNKYEKIFF